MQRVDRLPPARYGYQWLSDHRGTTDVSRDRGPDGPEGSGDGPDTSPVDTGTRRRP